MLSINLALAMELFKTVVSPSKGMERQTTSSTTSTNHSLSLQKEKVPNYNKKQHEVHSA